MTKTWISLDPETGESFSHAYLYTCAAFMLEQAEQKEDGRFHNCMVSMVFSAFFVEAYLNQLLEKLIPWWSSLNDELRQDVEKALNKDIKLRLITEYLEFLPEKGRRPFQSFGRLFRFRDQVVHAKPGQFPDIEKECTLENARRFLDDARGIVRKLHSKAGFGDYTWAQTGYTAWKKRLPSATRKSEEESQEQS